MRARVRAMSSQAQLVLRPYQEECIRATLDAWDAGVQRQAVSLPVGSGKTVIFASLASRLPPPTPQATKVLVLAHREELIAQAARQIARVSPHLCVGIEQGDARCNVSSADVIVASVPTLGRSKSGAERLVRFDPSLFKAVIIDEAHHAAAETYLRVLSHFFPNFVTQQLNSFKNSGKHSAAETEINPAINNSSEHSHLLNDNSNEAVPGNNVIAKTKPGSIVCDAAHVNVAGDCNDVLNPAHAPLIGTNDVIKYCHGDIIDEQATVRNERPNGVVDEAVDCFQLTTDTISAENNRILLWGCSATLMRQDDRCLGQVFEKVVYHMDTATAIRDGWLARAETFQVSTDVDINAVDMNAADFDPRSLSLAINTPVRNALVAATWLRLAWKEHKRRSTIVFALSIQHAHSLAAAFHAVCRSAGQECVAFENMGNADGGTNAVTENVNIVCIKVLTSETQAEERAQILDDFAQGKVHVLLNCAVLSEGTDIPRTDCIVMTRPTCNAGLYVQMVGRGLRRAEGKEYCLVLDFVDRLRASPRSLVTFPALLNANAPSNIKPGFSGGENMDEQPGKRQGRASEEIADLDAAVVRLHIEQSGHKSDSAEYLDEPLGPDCAVAFSGTGLAWIPLSKRHYALSCEIETLILRISEKDPSKGCILKPTLTALHGKRNNTWCLVPLKIDLELKSARSCNTIDFNDNTVLMHVDSASNDIPSGTREAPVIDLLARLQSYIKEAKLEHALSAKAQWRRVRPPSKVQARVLLNIFAEVDGRAASNADSKSGDADIAKVNKALRGRHAAIVYRCSVGRASDIITKYTLLRRLKLAPMPQSVSELLRGIAP